MSLLDKRRGTHGSMVIAKWSNISIGEGGAKEWNKEAGLDQFYS